jgi:hypothetical protein
VSRFVSFRFCLFRFVSVSFLVLQSPKKIWIRVYSHLIYFHSFDHLYIMFRSSHVNTSFLHDITKKCHDLKPRISSKSHKIFICIHLCIFVWKNNPVCSWLHSHCRRNWNFQNVK